MPSECQLDLFEHVAMAYGQTQSGRLSNTDLYKMAVGRAGHQDSVLKEKSPIGASKTPRNLVQRSIRWHQQTLRSKGLITKVDGQRGVWELTQSGKDKLRKVKPGAMVLGFSTNLGLAIWGDCKDVFSHLDEPICLALTSPPLPA
jgi:Mrr N-terminal domain